MAGTLTTSAGATSFRFLNNDRLSITSSIKSTSNVYIRNRNAPKASLHAVIDEPLVESTKMKSMSLYDVLNVERYATASEIKSAYRRLAKRYHPDASGSEQNDDDRDFIDIHNAYATLSDATARALYDLKLSTGFERRSGLYAAAGKSSGFYAGRRWETDQCW
ncbi:hypothetical protein L1987_79832 [Smallanthus sonchifolius]|uniref:Uncharacterized protein n=1 Tax=Smallanthus sonchifolius TaxID=185202 RepID=A0ACB8YK87_9ASTR|nr:hypothetical protein L1987_79832 [Smallanthus sonchifolius]